METTDNDDRWRSCRVLSTLPTVRSARNCYYPSSLRWLSASVAGGHLAVSHSGRRSPIDTTMEPAAASRSVSPDSSWNRGRNGVVADCDAVVQSWFPIILPFYWSAPSTPHVSVLVYHSLKSSTSRPWTCLLQRAVIRRSVSSPDYYIHPRSSSTRRVGHSLIMSCRRSQNR